MNLFDGCRAGIGLRVAILFLLGSVCVAEADTYTLTITEFGDGYGATSPPLGVWEYEANSQVELEGQPRAGSVFEGWQIDGVFHSGIDLLTVTMTSNKSAVAFFRLVGVNVSACATVEGTFGGYGDRITPGFSFLFSTGKQLLAGLEQYTNDYGGIRNLYVFTHAWNYNDPDGLAHEGGFWATEDPDFSGFYGTKLSSDHEDARKLEDLETMINAGAVKFVRPQSYLDAQNEVFLEGCHVGEIGPFVEKLGSSGFSDLFIVPHPTSSYRVSCRA